MLPPPRAARHRNNAENDAYDFLILETWYALQIGSWLRNILKVVATKEGSPLAYGNFKIQLIHTPARLSELWTTATENNINAHQRAIVRLHEIAYSLFSQIRHDYANTFEDGEIPESEGVVDPTERHRASLHAWKEMNRFWKLLHGKHAENFARFWVPLIQIHYGLGEEQMGRIALFE